MKIPVSSLVFCIQKFRDIYLFRKFVRCYVVRESIRIELEHSEILQNYKFLFVLKVV